MPTKDPRGRYAYGDRALAEELAIEIATATRELLQHSDRWDDQTKLAARRELAIQRDSAQRLQALFAETPRAA